jgi:hypothetical protein
MLRVGGLLCAVFAAAAGIDCALRPDDARTVARAEELYSCAKVACDQDRLDECLHYFRASVDAKALPYVLNDYGVFLKKHEADGLATDTFQRGLNALQEPWTSLDMELPANGLSSIISGPGHGVRALADFLLHPVIAHSALLFPNIAAFRAFAVARHDAWWLLPDATLNVERSAAFAMRVFLTWGPATPTSLQRASDLVQRNLLAPLPLLASLPSRPSAVLDAWTWLLLPKAVEMSLQFTTGAYEMGYIGVHPALRWLVTGARTWSSTLGRGEASDEISSAFGVLQRGPRWYSPASNLLPSRNRGEASARRRLGVRPRLRLAYISSDLRRHAIGWMVHGLFARHNRTAFATAAYNWGAVGAVKPYAVDFRLDITKVPSEVEPDWSRERPLFRDDYAARARDHGRSADVALAACDARLWGHTARLAASSDAFWNPGTWQTPAGYCNASTPGICPFVSVHADVVSNVLGHMSRSHADSAGNEVSRPHITIDLNGLTQGGIAAIGSSRPAPIAVHYLSGSESTSHPLRGDWTVVDATVLPPELATWPSYMDQLEPALRQSWCSRVAFRRRYPGKCVAHVFTEALAFLPGTFQANTYASAAAICRARRALAVHGPAHDLSACHVLSLAPGCAAAAGREFCGSSGRLVLIAFHSSFKIDAAVWASWMNILRTHPAAVLWLLKHKALSPQLSQRMRLNAASLGVHPGRILFVEEQPRELHMRRLTCGALYLDAWQYGAHSSGADALRFGLPVLTLQSDRFSSRVISSLLEAWPAHGDPAVHPARLLVTHSAAGFEESATRILHAAGTSSGRLCRVSDALSALMWSSASRPWPSAAAERSIGDDPSPGPFAYQAVASSLERAYHVMWDTRAVALALFSGYDVRESVESNGSTADGVRFDIGRTRRDFHVVIGA